MIWKRFSISAVIVSATGRMVADQNSDSKIPQMVSVSVSKRGFARKFAVSLDSAITRGAWPINLTLRLREHRGLNRSSALTEPNTGMESVYGPQVTGQRYCFIAPSRCAANAPAR